MMETFTSLEYYERLLLLGVIGIAIVSFLYAYWLKRDVYRRDKGTPEMQEVWEAIREGADAYLWRQLKTITPLIGLLTFVLFGSVALVEPSPAAAIEFPEYASDERKLILIIALGRTIAFLMGASFSLAVGQLGMRIAVQGNIRTAAAAKRSYNEALTVAYHAGTFTGMLTDGFGLLGGTVIFIIFGTAAPDALLGFGFGGTLLALFMRIGGGIYTKAADVGADLVGKIEQDIPEDDPRNAAVIADLVGDNVGDCAGMAADIFESYEVTIVSALILGLALYRLSGNTELVWIIFPLIVRAIGVISSIVGTYAVALWRTPNAEEAMFKSYEISSAITIFTSFLFATFYVGEWRAAFLVATGVMLAVSFNPITARFTAKHKGPVKEVIDSTSGGPATTILSGISLGYESSVWALFTIALSFILAILTFTLLPGNAVLPLLRDLHHVTVDTTNIGQYILYGIALIGIGMLSHTGNNVAMDSFGPISDNAQGIGEICSLDPETRSVLDELDAVGNTTKAITKGIAIASAVIAAVSLFASFATDVRHIAESLAQSLGIPVTDPLEHGIRVDVPLIFVGLLLGGALPWLFSAFNIRAVNRAATMIIEEVRRQFRIPGLMEGKVKPDYRQAVSISTAAAQKELVSLAIIAVSMPIMVGAIFGAMLTLSSITGINLDLASIGSGVEALGGFQAGIIISGQLLAVYMANAGGAWDNAKKAIEDEPRNLEANTGKGSERHKAGVIGDTVGDPLKDTAGPSLNPMIKVVNLVSLILAPLLVQASVQAQVGEYGLFYVLIMTSGVLLLAFAWAYRKSNRKVESVFATIAPE